MVKVLMVVALMESLAHLPPLWALLQLALRLRRLLRLGLPRSHPELDRHWLFLQARHGA